MRLQLNTYIWRILSLGEVYHFSHLKNRQMSVFLCWCRSLAKRRFTGVVSFKRSGTFLLKNLNYYL